MRSSAVAAARERASTEPSPAGSVPEMDTGLPIFIAAWPNHPRAGPSVWTVNDFLDLGTDDAVRKMLQRLATSGEIRRIDDGRYYKPQFNRLTRNDSPPNASDMIDAVARRKCWSMG